MRKVFVPFAALLLCAAPVYAQQGADAQPVAVEQAEAVQAAEVPAAQPAEARAPSLAVSREEIRQRVAAIEEQRESKDQMGGQGFWWTVAAVAIGVIVALLLIE
jgi:hypothetical protein